MATSPSPSTFGRTLAGTEAASSVLPPTTPKFYPIPSIVSIAIIEYVPPVSEETPAMPDATSRAKPAATTGAGPVLSATQPDIGDGANIPVTWTATMSPTRPRPWPWATMCTGAIAMTATMTTFVEARIDTAMRAEGALRPEANPVRGGRVFREAPSKPAPRPRAGAAGDETQRSEEHTSELQSRQYLVCRLLLEKKNE